MIVDSENYRKGGQDSKLSIPEIILQQIQRIVKLGSIEFRGSYENESVVMIDGQSTVIKNYVPDSRQEYINAVSNLSYLLEYYLCGKSVKVDAVLKDINDIKEKMELNHKQFIEDLNKPNVDKNKLRYQYISRKCKLSEDMFKEYIGVIKKTNAFETSRGIVDV